MNNETCRLVQGRYGVLNVFANDIGAATKSLLTYGEWAENEICFLRAFIPKEHATVVDVGAYIGSHTLAFARSVGPSGTVVAIEAQPETFKVLEQNVAANEGSRSLPNGLGPLGRILPIQAAASSRVSQVTIPVIDPNRPNSYGSASLSATLTENPFGRQKLSDTEELQFAVVDTITIDSLGLPDCALLKIDVEGVEHLVLEGALETLVRHSPIVYCECNSIAAGSKSMRLLKHLNYRVFAHVVTAFNPDNHYGVADTFLGDAKEVALLGIPPHQEHLLTLNPTREHELLLTLEDEDDLALALLNKPQYEEEVLRPGAAGRSGGAALLTTFHSDCPQQERAGPNQEVPMLRAELLGLHHLLTNRDLGISKLQEELLEETQKVERLHNLLATRDADISRLQGVLTEQAQKLSDLHTFLTQRDASVIQLQSVLEERDQTNSELHALLTERDAAILRLQKQGTLTSS